MKIAILGLGTVGYGVYDIIKTTEVLKDIEIKYILKNALTDKINDRDVYMKGIDHSYYYEGYITFKAEEL